MKTPNQKTMTIKLRRRDIVDLMTACAWAAVDAGVCSDSKWRNLHEVLREQLDEFDSKEANK